MLVTLGSNATIAAGSSQTFQYACNSLQKVYIRCDDDSTDSLLGNLTVQIGNDVICNDIPFTGLSYISLLQGGGRALTADAYFAVDFGSHILEPLENVYVTIRNRGTASMTATDVSATVNQGGIYEPLKLTNYADNVFTDSNTLCVYAYGGNLENDTTAFTVRNQAYSATPQVQSGVNVSLSMVQGEYDTIKYCAVMAKNQVPLDTSVNYSSTIVSDVICVSAMEKQPTKEQASAKAGQAVLSSMTSSERKAL
jgi:hypothetical protein